MRINKITAIILALLLVLVSSVPVYAKTNSNSSSTVSADFYSKFGNTKVNLKTGFDFINSDSGTEDLNLALTGLTLSGQMYYDDKASSQMIALGYDYAKYYYHTDLAGFVSPTVCFGYKRLIDDRGAVKNIFAIAVRGTQYPIDWITDINDGTVWMFELSKSSVMTDFADFLKCNEVNKTREQLKKEDTYFFITGHSLGGAVANCLSVDGNITSFTNNKKERIYTYTFESPHTCINLWWTDVSGISNAFNYKNIDDPITHLPPYFGSTTYGKDKSFSVADLNYSIFDALFPNEEYHDFDSAIQGTAENHHERSLSLVYIVQNGIQQSVWNDINDVLTGESVDSDLDGLWSDGNNMVKISNANGSTLEFYPYFARAWSPDENITARSTGDGCYQFDDGNGFAGRMYLEGETLDIDVSPVTNIVANHNKSTTYKYTKIDDSWKTAYKNFLASEEYLKTAAYYDDIEKKFLLIDLTSDLIPELVITTGGNGRSTRGSYIYGYENGEVKLKTTSGVGLYAYSIQNDTVYFTVSELTGAQAEEPQYNNIVYIDWLKCTDNQIERKPAKIERYTSESMVDTEFLVGNGADDMYGLIQLALEENYYSGNFKPFMYQNIYFSLSEALFDWDTFIRTSIIAAGGNISW